MVEKAGGFYFFYLLLFVQDDMKLIFCNSVWKRCDEFAIWQKFLSLHVLRLGADR